MPNPAVSPAPFNALPLPLEDVAASTLTTGSLPYGGSVYGIVDAANDRDWYAMQVIGGMTYDFRLLGVGRSPLANPFLSLRDGSGAVLASNDNAGGAFGNNAAITYTATSNGYVYVDAGALRSGTGDFILTAATDRNLMPILSIDEVAWQLTNNFERYFNYGSATNVPATAYDLSGDRTLTYNITQLTPAGKALAVQALQMWSDVTGITFIATSGTADLGFDDSDTDVNAYNSNVTSVDGTISSSALMISTGWLAQFGTTLNSYSFETTLHELGHALGLGHGGNYNGSATYGFDNYYMNDSQHLSIMSYMQSAYDEFARDLRDYNTFSSAQFRWVLTPMIADILAMSHLYGLSSTTRTGNTTYGYNSNTGNAALDAATSLNDQRNNNYVAFTIFDNGGIDTVDMSGFAGPQRIDLREGASSDILGGRLNMGVAYGTVVENAYGGGGHDEIYGNDSNNMLRGEYGNDTLYGFAGNDTLNGGESTDTLYGGDGDDTFRITNSTYSELFSGDAGADTLDLNAYTSSGFNVDLSAQTFGMTEASTTSRVTSVENVRGTDFGDRIVGKSDGNVLRGMYGDDFLDGGGGSDSLDGGGGRDTLLGGSGNDTLDGGLGGDSMSGGGGNDRYVTDTGDVVVEAVNAGIDRVDSSASYTLSANVENLFLIGTAAVNGSGNTLANLIIGNTATNSLFGGAGADTLLAGSGDDKLNGETFEAGFDPVSAQVYRLYQAVLDRAPDQVGQLSWTNRINSGSTSLQQAAHNFVTSAEFQSTYGATSNAAFVTLLYDNVLDRAPDSGGFATWTAALNSGQMSRAEVVTGFSESAEFNRSTIAEAMAFSRAGLQADWADDVYRLYRATLDRAPDLGGLTTWTMSLAQGRNMLSVVEGFTGSAEFIARYGATSNTDFVTLLYRNVLDRDPDAGGLTTWTGSLQNGSLTRSEVVRNFAASAEFVRSTTADLTTFFRTQIVDDRLEAGAGNDLLFGGLGADVFVFDLSDKGNHTVVDLEAWDRIDLQGFGYPTVIEIRAHLTQVGDDVLFSDRGVSVTFVDTALSAMTDSVLGV